MSSDGEIAEIIDVEIYLLFLQDTDIFVAIRELQHLKQKYFNYRYIKENSVVSPCIVIETKTLDDRIVTKAISKHLQRIGYNLPFEIFKPLYC